MGFRGVFDAGKIVKYAAPIVPHIPLRTIQGSAGYMLPLSGAIGTGAGIGTWMKNNPNLVSNTSSRGEGRSAMPYPTQVQKRSSSSPQSNPWQKAFTSNKPLFTNQNLGHAAAQTVLSGVPYIGPALSGAYNRGVATPALQAGNSQRTTTSATGDGIRGNYMPSNPPGMFQTRGPRDNDEGGDTGINPRGNDLAPDGTGSRGTNMGWKGITAPMLTEEALLKSPYMRDKVINPLNAGNTTRPGFQQFTADKSIFDDADLGNLEAWNKGLDLGSAGASGSNARPGEWASSIDMGPGGAPDVGFGQDSMMLPSSLTGANTEAGVGGSWEDTPLGAEDMAWVQIADDAKRRRDIMLGGGHSMDLLNQLKYDKGYITRGGQHYKVGGDGTPVSEDVFRNDMGWGTGVAGMSPAAIDSENPKGLQTELGQAVGTAADWVEWNTDMPLDAEPIPYRPSGLYEWNTGMPLGASAIPYRPNY